MYSARGKMFFVELGRGKSKLAKLYKYIVILQYKYLFCVYTFIFTLNIFGLFFIYNFLYFKLIISLFSFYRNSLRRIARNDDHEFSRESIVNLMEKFVKTVNVMDETILVPCRLMDRAVGLSPPFPLCRAVPNICNAMCTFNFCACNIRAPG